MAAGAGARTSSPRAVGLWADAWSLDLCQPAARRAARVLPASRAEARRTGGYRQGEQAARNVWAPSGVEATMPARPARVSESLPAITSRPYRPAAHTRPTRRRPLIAPLGLLVLTLAVFLLAPLALNVASMRAEWRLSELDQRQGDLGAERSALRAKVSALSSTQRIEEEAISLGLAPDAEVGFVVLDGDADSAVGAGANADGSQASAEAGSSGG